MKTNAEARREGHDGEVDFCRVAIAHGRTIRCAHPDVIAELGLASGIRAVEGSTPYDVSLEGIVPTAHEIKRKKPTNWEPPPYDPGPCYGLEDYRLKKLVALAEHGLVYYSIQHGPGELWRTANILTLDTLRHERIAVKHETGRRARSYFGGEWHENVPIWYFPVRFWKPLTSTWPSPP